MDPHDPVSERQVAPTPNFIAREHQDKQAAIRRVRAENPAATVDEIIAALARQKIEVSAAMVFQEMQDKPSAETG
jgi:hypothetical protein